jgi:hypothetical protein
MALVRGQGTPDVHGADALFDAERAVQIRPAVLEEHVTRRDI